MATREEALYNCLQFAGDKKSGSGGQIRTESVGNTVMVMAHDDFTFILDTYEVIDTIQGVRYYDKEDIKAFLKDPGHTFQAVEPVDAESFEVGLELIRDAKINQELKVEPIAVSAERFRKLSLVKPQGNPVDMLVCEDDGHPYVAFKIGPTAKGLLSVLDRSVVAEELGPEVMW